MEKLRGLTIIIVFQRWLEESGSKRKKLSNETNNLPEKPTPKIHIPRVIRVTGMVMSSLFIWHLDFIGSLVYKCAVACISVNNLIKPTCCEELSGIMHQCMPKSHTVIMLVIKPNSCYALGGAKPVACDLLPVWSVTVGSPQMLTILNSTLVLTIKLFIVYFPYDICYCRCFSLGRGNEHRILCMIGEHYTAELHLHSACSCFWYTFYRQCLKYHDCSHFTWVNWGLRC